MTIEEFVSTKHDGSGAAKGCGHYFNSIAKYEGSGYDYYTYYGEAHGDGSDAERKSCGFGEAGGTSNLNGKGFGGIRIKY